jgi:hypothetical protein
MTVQDKTMSALQLKPMEIAAGAVAAVVAAFASSFLGVAGTMVGTALASVVTTVSAAVVRHSAQRTNESLQRTNVRLRATLHQRAATGSTAVGPHTGTTVHTEAGQAVGGGEADLTDRYRGTTGEPNGAGGPSQPDARGELGVTDRTGVSERADDARRSPWTRKGLIAVGAGSLIAFAVALGAITGLESAIGKPLSALLGNNSDRGTTLGQVIDGTERTAGRQDAPTSDAPATTVPASPTTSTDASPTEAPSTTSSTESPSSSTPTTTAPIPSPTPTGLVGPTARSPAPGAAATP